MQTLANPKDKFSLLNGRIRIHVLNKDPLREEIVGYYSNGQLHFKNYSGKQGFEGDCLGWHENGVLCVQSPYENGKLQGVLKRWHNNELLSYEGLYNCDLQEGIHREYHENGTIKAEKAYKKGILNGISKEWHDNGQIESEAFYVKGRIEGDYKRWYSNGQIALQENFQRGLKYGFFKEWWENGKPRSSIQYTANVLEGPYGSWDENGYTLSSGKYIRGMKYGKCCSRLKINSYWSEDYYIRDVIVPKVIFELLDTDKLTAKQILQIENTTIRRVCLEEFGYERLLSQMEHSILDVAGEQELVRIKWHKREENIYLVKVKCPSTGAFYTLRVPPTMKKVKEAVAWTFGIHPDQYCPEKET